MGKAVRLCIFCGANAGSKEHIWPVWLHEHMGPPPANARHNRELHNFHPSTGKVSTGPIGRQGDLRTVRVRAVCAPCNNGWMSQLESAVRPYLSPIVRGLPVSLLPPAVETLAQWIALKAMVAEHSAPSVALTPQADRQAFAQERTIPTYYRIYVAHNLSKSQSLYYRTSQAIGFSADGPNPSLEGMAKNIHAMTMIIGRAVLHVTAARIADFEMEEKVLALGFHDRCRIWPPPLGPISFPARPNLDMNGIMLVATGLQRYFAVSKKTWTETPWA